MVEAWPSAFETVGLGAGEMVRRRVRTYHKVSEGALSLFGFWLIEDNALPILLKLWRTGPDRTFESWFASASSCCSHEEIKETCDYNSRYHRNHNYYRPTRLVCVFDPFFSCCHDWRNSRFVRLVLQSVLGSYPLVVLINVLYGALWQIGGGRLTPLTH